MQKRIWTCVPQVVIAILFVMFSGVCSFASENENMLGADSVVRNSLLKKLGNEDDLRSLCSGLKKCLNIDFPGCSAGDKHTWPHLKYDEAYCSVYHEVVKRGFEPKPGVPMAEEVFARLGRRYRAIYENKGTLPLGENVISYLFDNMPFTARAGTAGILTAVTDGAFRANSTGPCKIAQGKNLACVTCFSATGMRRCSSGRCMARLLPSWIWTKLLISRLSIN